MNKQSLIAATIQQQLYAGGVPVVWSWGAHKWFALPETSEFDGGLLFTVNGALYQGQVRIMLAYDDTYTILLDGLTPQTNVYCDQLTDIIDSLVETP